MHSMLKLMNIIRFGFVSRSFRYVIHVTWHNCGSLAMQLFNHNKPGSFALIYWPVIMIMWYQYKMYGKTDIPVVWFLQRLRGLNLQKLLHCWKFLTNWLWICDVFCPLDQLFKNATTDFTSGSCIRNVGYILLTKDTTTPRIFYGITKNPVKLW